MQTPRFPTRLARAGAAAAVWLGLLAGPPAQAAEGMWPLDALPRAQMQQRYGFEPGPGFVDKLMQGSARLGGGCSGSFVSAEGLVLTNHHCITRCLGQLSSAAANRLQDGFVARSRAQELRCPDLEITRLESITDVTAQLRAATAGKQGADFQAAEDALRARLTRECRAGAEDTTRCDLVLLYRGGLAQLYKYRLFSDVRLVWAPEEAIAAFGGDPDNFNFPRWCLDAALLRVYEGGAPAVLRQHLRLQPAGAQAGELVFSSGHPGGTDRQMTTAQLQTLRDELAQNRLPQLAELRGVMLQAARGEGEQRRFALAALQGVENSIKVVGGQLQALLDPALLASKRQAEDELRAFVAARPELTRRVGDPWADIARAQAARRELQALHGLIEDGRAFSGDLFSHARTLVRAAAERPRPDAERLREYSDASLPRLQRRLLAAVPHDPAFEELRLAWSLNRLRSVLGPDDPWVQRVLGRLSPQDRARQLVQGTRMADAAERQRLWQGGAAALAQSDDPFIVLARSIDDAARALRQRFESEVLAVERQAAQRLALAAFERGGPALYPDATGTLRLSYGEVSAVPERGRVVPPFTDLRGLAARATGASPFALPGTWQAALPRLDPAQRLNLSASLDIIGGNSGSPLLNRQGEVVGLVFDGNLGSLGGAFSYDERVNRAIAVHSGAIVEALRSVYAAPGLVAELLPAP